MFSLDKSNNDPCPSSPPDDEVDGDGEDVDDNEGENNGDRGECGDAGGCEGTDVDRQDTNEDVNEEHKDEDGDNFVSFTSLRRDRSRVQSSNQGHGGRGIGYYGAEFRSSSDSDSGSEEYVLEEGNEPVEYRGNGIYEPYWLRLQRYVKAAMESFYEMDHADEVMDFVKDLRNFKVRQYFQLYHDKYPYLYLPISKNWKIVKYLVECSPSPDIVLFAFMKSKGKVFEYLAPKEHETDSRTEDNDNDDDIKDDDEDDDDTEEDDNDGTAFNLFTEGITLDDNYNPTEESLVTLIRNGCAIFEHGHDEVTINDVYLFMREYIGLISVNILEEHLKNI